uniref:Palmitoyltransferase n=1 Tax=Phallusia mammillata TaxID=59560 RepID=A0A6F9DWS1_9ASCI|nr:ZF(DHHC)-2 zinc finger protein [Phallusia mammillata]
MSYPKQPAYPSQPAAQGVILSDIVQAVQQNAPTACLDILKANPEKVDVKGFIGTTPLHQACLRGVLSIAEILLDRGADPNARSDHGETPVLYACRNGNVSLIHLLLTSGGDVDATDKNGNGCMHYASLGGSIVAVHYIGTQTHLNFNMQNNNGDTPLHISCQNRSNMLTNFLLRNSRCDPCIQNNKGVTALHIAAQLGDSELCWRLLTIATCRLCHIKDELGNTPLDIARNEPNQRNKSLPEQLAYYSKLDPITSPNGPKGTWLTLAFLPFVWAGAVFVLSSYLGSFAALFALIAFLLLVAFVSRQSHRIPHPCGWPNPIFLGGFAAGIVHCIIGAFFKILPALWPCPVHFLVIVTLCLICLYYLRYLAVGDPGIIRHGRVSADGRELAIMDIVRGNTKEADFCPYTEVIKPEWSKYCRLCERTVKNLDHHCLFLNNCIATLNHRSFVVFLLVVMMLQTLFVVDVLLITETDMTSAQSYISQVFHAQPWLFDLALLCVLSFMWEFTLVASQLINISRGQTGYFKRCKGKLTKMEALLNIVRFFLNRKHSQFCEEKYPQVDGNSFLHA